MDISENPSAHDDIFVIHSNDLKFIPSITLYFSYLAQRSVPSSEPTQVSAHGNLISLTIDQDITNSCYKKGAMVVEDKGKIFKYTFGPNYARYLERNRLSVGDYVGSSHVDSVRTNVNYYQVIYSYDSPDLRLVCDELAQNIRDFKLRLKRCDRVSPHPIIQSISEAI